MLKILAILKLKDLVFHVIEIILEMPSFLKQINALKNVKNRLFIMKYLKFVNFLVQLELSKTLINAHNVQKAARNVLIMTFVLHAKKE